MMEQDLFGRMMLDWRIDRHTKIRLSFDKPDAVPQGTTIERGGSKIM